MDGGMLATANYITESGWSRAVEILKIKYSFSLINTVSFSPLKSIDFKLFSFAILYFMYCSWAVGTFEM